MGTIYYIGCHETLRVKIGFTRGNPEVRLKALQTGSPTKLALIAEHPGEPEMERALHNDFAPNRAHGEWFDFSEEMYQHLATITWLNAEQAIATGKQIDRKTKVALQGMRDIAPLTDKLVALL